MKNLVITSMYRVFSAFPYSVIRYSLNLTEFFNTCNCKMVSEAEEALVAAQGAPVKQLEPLTLFHLRDALQVCTLPSVLLQESITV